MSLTTVLDAISLRDEASLLADLAALKADQKKAFLTRCDAWLSHRRDERKSASSDGSESQLETLAIGISLESPDSDDQSAVEFLSSAWTDWVDVNGWCANVVGVTLD